MEGLKGGEGEDWKIFPVSWRVVSMGQGQELTTK